MITRAGFLRSLWNEGRVRVPAVTASPADGPLMSDEERQALSRVLQECAAVDRRECPGQPPALHLESAIWASEMLFRACSAVVHRSLSSETLAELFSPASVPNESIPSPQAAYSVDLAFRFLFDVARIARAASAADPLLPYLKAWGEAWPLSSVGMPGLAAVDVSPFWEDCCLRTLYVDRVIDRQDHSRLEDDRVQIAVKEALGLYPELAPPSIAALVGSVPQ